MRLLVVLTAAVCVSAAAELYRGRPEFDADWKDFKGKHGKNYKDSTEESERRKHWEANRDAVDKHNKEAAEGKHTFTMKQNHLSDWTAEERRKLLGRRAGNVTSRAEVIVVDALEFDRQTPPASVDLRTHFCMPPIKNQGNCGSCWAFGATTPTEFTLCRRTGNTTKVILSEQQLVDCDRTNYGCDGGWETNAWTYIKNAPGQTLLSKYPYTSGSSGVRGTCKYTASMSRTNITGYVAYLSKSNLSAIQLLLSQRGPLTASIDAVNSFDYYGSGVYSDSTCSRDGVNTNHVVVLVGYGTLNAIPHWIVRNSWGTYWGLSGYMLIKRGVNMCNIEAQVAYPTL